MLIILTFTFYFLYLQAIHCQVSEKLKKHFFQGEKSTIYIVHCCNQGQDAQNYFSFTSSFWIMI
jgi:hypothetical protein